MANTVAERNACFAGRAAGRRGITLIELLVVIAILVVVIATLAPALSKIQRQARTLTCLSNLRQIHLAFNTYLIENDEQSLPYDPTYKTFWIRTLRPLTADSADLWKCPEASNLSYGWGHAQAAWGPYDASHGTQSWMNFLQHESSSYGLNGWFYAGMNNQFSDGSDLNRMPVFADANWLDAMPRDSDPVPTDLHQGAASGGGDLGRFCIARHGISVNVSFRDGHAEQVPLTQLWRLKWSKSFKDRLVVLPVTVQR